MDGWEPAFDAPEDLPERRGARGAARSAGKGAAVETFSAAELRTMRFPEIKYVVSGYVVEGCTILAGAPKIGKSWLVMDIAIAKAAGGQCLGSIETHEAADVLYLALEDNKRRLQNRIDKLLAVSSEWPARLTFATEWPRANVGGLDRIREWARKCERPGLVIVDVLTMFRPPANGRDQLYDHDYNSIKSLQALAAELGIAIVIVHHTRKSRDQVDAFDRMSGTLGLSGAADAVIILDRDSNGTTLYVRGRDVPESETALTFNKDRCRWSVLGRASEVRLSDERKVILDVLKVTDEPMSPAEIAGAANLKSNSVKQLLFKMAAAGEVLKVGRGRYLHPDRAPPEP